MSPPVRASPCGTLMLQNWGEEDSIHGTLAATSEQVVGKLREGERLLGWGKDFGEVCRHLEVSEATWRRWRNQFGGVGQSPQHPKPEPTSTTS